jgi:hypothetical protein
MSGQQLNPKKLISWKVSRHLYPKHRPVFALAIMSPVSQPSDDLFSAPSIRTSRPATGGRRGAVRGFSPESGVDSPSPFEATPVLTQPPPAASRKPKKEVDDWDDADMDFDIDSLLTDSDKVKSKSVLMNEPSKGRAPLAKPEPLDDSLDSIHVPSTPVGNHQTFTRPNSAPVIQKEREVELIIDKEPPEASSGTQLKKNDEEVDLGFVPSFLESGREPRSRRLFSSLPTTLIKFF